MITKKLDLKKEIRSEYFKDTAGKFQNLPVKKLLTDFLTAVPPEGMKLSEMGDILALDRKIKDAKDYVLLDAVEYEILIAAIDRFKIVVFDGAIIDYAKSLRELADVEVKPVDSVKKKK